MLLFVPLGVYIFVYPFGLGLLALGLLPPGAAWVGGALLLAQAAVMLTWLALNHGASRGLVAGALVASLAWALEALGVTSGWPFGAYSYTPALGTFLGPVPLAIPFAWVATVGAALITARLLLNGRAVGGAWGAATFAALLAAGQDFVLEPVATTVQGYWQWHTTDALAYGVPWQNFATWFFAALLLGRLALAVLGPAHKPWLYPWLPPLLVFLAVFMFGLLDLLKGYGLAALVALPLLLVAVAALRCALPVTLARQQRLMRCLLPLLILGGAALLQGCGTDDFLLTQTAREIPTSAATAVPPTATLSPIPPTSTTPPSPTGTPALTPTPEPPTATAVVLAPNPSTTSTLLLRALDAMQALSSYEYTATVQSYELGNSVATRSSGAFVAPDRLHWTTSTSTITTEAVLSGSLYYVSYDPGDWIMVSGGERARAGQLPWTLIAYATAAQLIDEPVEDGVTLLHIGFDVPLERVALDNRQWQFASGEVWLSSFNQRVLALKLKAADPSYDTTQRFFFFNFNKPAQIVVPDQ